MDKVIPAARAVVADGDDALRQRLASVLTQRGWEVHQAGDGIAALETVRRLHPALLMVEDILPAVDGLSVCWAVTRDPLLAGTRVVIMTGDAGLASRGPRMGIEAAAYLTKPFPDDDVAAATPAAKPAGAPPPPL